MLLRREYERVEADNEGGWHEFLKRAHTRSLTGSNTLEMAATFVDEPSGKHALIQMPPRSNDAPLYKVPVKVSLAIRLTYHSNLAKSVSQDMSKYMLLLFSKKWLQVDSTWPIRFVRLSAAPPIRVQFSSRLRMLKQYKTPVED